MNKYEEFLRVAGCLNTELEIIPVLYGSLGLARVINQKLDPKDIDLLIPKKYLTSNWGELKKVLEKIDYKVSDEQEHEFVNSGFKIGIAHEEDLIVFAGIDFKKLKITSDAGVNYKILNIKQL